MSVHDPWKMMDCRCQHLVVTVMTHHCYAGTCGAKQLHAAPRFLLPTAMRCCCCLQLSLHMMLNLAVSLMLHLLLIAWLLLVMPQRVSQRQAMGLLQLLIAVPTSDGCEPHCMRWMSH